MKSLKNDTNIVCFYHEYNENGCFSNWYKADFEYVGLHFNSVEQFMMYHKVLMFHQHDLAQKILTSDDPAIIKKLGRTYFPEFNSAVWDKTCYAIVKRGVRAKFEQNDNLLHKLIATGEKTLAECSLKDTKWGIGVEINDPKRYNTIYWNGKNYLGRILMEVRDELRYLKNMGIIGYKDSRDINFTIWNNHAGTLLQNPKYHDAINAYVDTLRSQHEKRCFLYDGSLEEWETAMRTNMGGGLTAIGFWELKQDLFDISRV